MLFRSPQNPKTPANVEGRENISILNAYRWQLLMQDVVVNLLALSRDLLGVSL